MSRWILLCASGVLGCTAPAPLPLEKPASPPPPFFTIQDAGLGPIDKDTRANLTALRELVGPHGFTVRPINDAGVEYHVYDGSEHLFYVIPNDDGSLFNVHVVAGSIPITQHPEWVIGMPLVRSDLLTACEPWGNHPVCWRDGEHVALGFRVETSGLDSADGRRENLEGVPIQRAVWSPRKFGEDDVDGGGSARLPEWIPRNDP